MANLVASIGYSLGKLHSGMIAYLCELHREGSVRPLQTFLEALGVPIPERPVAAVREWNSIDLAILDAEDRQPQILVEMKVDDHDHETTKWIDGKKRRDSQTVLYADLFPNCGAYLYVTLGMGESFHAPYGPNFRWIRIRDFLAAVDRLEGKDQAIRDWAEAIRNELDLQDRVRRNDRSRMNQYRSGAWNIYFLGYLKESFEERSRCAGGAIDATCYTYGTAPDTILNFGWSRYPAYLEINNNGRLNLKINLEECATDDDKRRAIRTLLEEVTAAYQAGIFGVHEGGRVGASKTVASFDIGLRPIDGALQFANSQEDTLQRLQQVVEPFYSRGA